MSDIRQGEVTLKGNPVNLAGKALTAGAAAPDYSLQGNGLEEVTLASSQGKTRIIATIPSLDTAVCSLETKSSMTRQRLCQMPRSSWSAWIYRSDRSDGAVQRTSTR